MVGSISPLGLLWWPELFTAHKDYQTRKVDFKVIPFIFTVHTTTGFQGALTEEGTIIRRPHRK
jgi:hypothetical protein